MSRQHPLKTYRTSQKLTLDALASKLKVNKSTLLRWEEGAVLLPIGRLDLVERLTGIPRKDLRPDVFKGAA